MQGSTTLGLAEGTEFYFLELQMGTETETTLSLTRPPRGLLPKQPSTTSRMLVVLQARSSLTSLQTYLLTKFTIICFWSPLPLLPWRLL